MAPPASKRRKLEHCSIDDALADDAASFDSSEESMDEASPGAAGELENGALSEEEDEGLDSGEGGSEDGSESEAGLAPAGKPDEDGPSSKASKKGKTRTADSSAARKRVGKEQAFISGNFKSNMFKLQVDELLQQIKPRQGRREKAAEDALHQLKTTIDGIPARAPLPIAEAEKQLLKEHGTVVPFSEPRPPKDAKYKLEYHKPASVNVAGSYALKTASRSKGDGLSIDMVVAMPSSLLQDKDFLNRRYFYKRAYYLACIAGSLNATHAGSYDIRFADFHDNPLQPVISVEPKTNDEKLAWRVNILVCTPANVFPAEKLHLEKNCVRASVPAQDADQQGSTQPPTPFYNSSLRADMLVTPYLKLLHASSKSCEAFQDACLLGSTWLRQRGLGAELHGGGFGNFECNALMALMLSGGGPKGTPILSAGYSSYQLFKATLQFLAMKDLSKQPFIFGSSEYTPKPLQDGTPVVWDAQRAHNLLYRMPIWAYRHLKREARTTLSMLGDQQYDGFDAAFILRSDTLSYKYDCVLEMTLTVDKKDNERHAVMQQNMYRALRKGLGDRVAHINIIPSSSESWKVNASPKRKLSQHFRVGIAVNPETVGRTVDHGPSAEEKAAAADFRSFWGEKAELRRFKDGSILESLVWSASEDGPSVLEQIARYVIAKHVSKGAAETMYFHGDQIKSLLPHDNATARFSALQEAYKQMESDVRGLEGLPLSIRQIMPADAQLRSASLSAPLGGSRPMPADVVIQFEGSGRWPDDLVAIQRTKIAFSLKLSELLQESVDGVAAARIGLENPEHDILNQTFLDIIYDSGAAFRVRIYHDREQTLLERRLKDKTLDPRSKEVSALGLAKHKRDYVKAPAHTQALARLCGRHPPLSATMRATKKWFAAHLLGNHIADEVIELLVARTFVQPWPWPAPSSAQTAFLRTLFFLSRWDWRAEPLIVDLSSSGGGSGEDFRAAATTAFEAWRKVDPALHRVVLFAASDVDREGTTWTDGRPAKVVAGRMTALARAAVAEMGEKGVALELAGLFASSLHDFDFVLHLSPALAGGKKQRKGKEKSGFKNLALELASSSDDASLAGFEPARDFLRELETLYGAAALFFSALPERPVIAGLWNPGAEGRAWKLNLAFSSVPVVEKGGDGEAAVKARVNREAIMAEIARLGGEMVTRVEGRGG